MKNVLAALVLVASATTANARSCVEVNDELGRLSIPLWASVMKVAPTFEVGMELIAMAYLDPNAASNFWMSDLDRTYIEVSTQRFFTLIAEANSKGCY